MLVEDDVDLGGGIAELLEDEGYDVSWARNGAEALSLLRAGSGPCVIILDMMMPVMNGWEFLAQLDADPTLASIPVVVSTAATSRLPQGRPLLKKPFKLAALSSAVKTYC
jgi:CheY-like chemotaxis protein